ncbi:MAG TPA: amidohydrolase family protein [Nevskiaceae bacterium]|nr:amidohydrolase family protein [Nevskiaceae bacterium]
MTRHDLLLRGGTVVDGTGGPRRVADVAIGDGVIRAIGALDGHGAARVVEAQGLIVAPGVIDPHTHYDAQVNWDPWATASGWHGMTSAVIGNCGFGYAPVRPELRVRSMQMMVNTEQIPYAAQAAGLPWTWETFPQWLDHLRRLPKGVNLASFLPVNPLLVHVMGLEAAKSRPATTDERRRLRALLHEAMDAGAAGFAFSYLGVEGNSHVDFDMTPMPSDLMAPEEAFNLCVVLRERGEGIVQLLSEMPATPDPGARRAFVEELARRSGRPVIQNVLVPVRGHPEFHRSGLAWLDACREKGLEVWMQAFLARGWTEFHIMDMNAWDAIPVFRAMTAASTVDARLALACSTAYRERLRREYRADAMYQALGPLEAHVLLHAGSDTFRADEGRTLAQIAADRGAGITDLFLDVLVAGGMQSQFRVDTMIAEEPEWIAELLRHPRILAGSSDGGAHGKFHCGGQWSTDVIQYLSRETHTCTLEELHAALSAKPARLLGWSDRGTLAPGQAADVLVYDHAQLGYTFGRYDVLHDLPGGEWRRVAPARGVRMVIVNGVPTFEDGTCTGATPGRVLQAPRTAAATA